MTVVEHRPYQVNKHLAKIQRTLFGFPDDNRLDVQK